MMTMKRLISIIICISLTLTLCSCGRGLKRFEKSFLDVFDTASTVIAYDTDAQSFEKHYTVFHNMLMRYHNLFDIYASHDGMVSLKDVNEKAARAPVKVDASLFRLLAYGKEVYTLTNGAVNICMGSVLAVWHTYREEGTRLPDEALLREAAKHCDIDDMILDSENATVFFKDSEMSLDVGAIAKGYAAQQMMKIAGERFGWDSMLLNLGGNISTSGLKPDGTKWNVQIENPRGGAALDTLSVTDTAVVTSGDYQRYYEVNGKRYCHIIDPQTLLPAEHFTSVSIICEDAALADALSTALFILPLDEGKKIADRLGVKAVWADKNGAVTKM